MPPQRVSSPGTLLAMAALLLAASLVASSRDPSYAALPLHGVEAAAGGDEEGGRCCSSCWCYYQADPNSCRCRDRREDGCYEGCKRCMCARTWQRQCICFDASDSCAKLNPCKATAATQR